jgi:ribosomal protein L44E
MPEKICPYCEESFDANSLETESCRKTKCVKANQRRKKRKASGVTEVKRGRPKSHVAVLKEKVISRIKAKSGKSQGPSTTPSAGGNLPVPEVPPLAKVRRPSDLMDVPKELWPKTGAELGVLLEKNCPPLIPTTFTPHTVENHGSINDLARSVIFSRVKQPVSTDLSKSQLHTTKGS